MPKSSAPVILVGDFETTVYEGQKDTQVWASALVPLYTENVLILGSINETFDYLTSLDTDVIVYYHNVKFDGSFWLYYLALHPDYTQAVETESDSEGQSQITAFTKTSEMKNGTYKYVISSMGQWYSVVVKRNGHTIEFRDSLKLLPFSVEELGISFGTKHRKLSMKYEGQRYPNCPITMDEKRYIANDVLVVKEALEIMFNEGHTKLTIGACCLAEYKRIIGAYDYNLMFPNLYDMELDNTQYGSTNVGDYIRKSYRGGWCYLVEGKQDKLYKKGVTADVNSLYPSVMSSESGSVYPVGTPKFWKGNYIPDFAIGANKYYFVRIRTRFFLKNGYLPFVQIKGNKFYKGNEMQKTSDIYNPKTGRYTSKYIDFDGTEKTATLTLTLTCTDFELLKKHYHLIDCEILDGCAFYARAGIFDEYINKYAEIKMKSKGAKRTLAKLFLNNLYGKMAASTDSSFKVAYLDPDTGALRYKTVKANEKTPGFIAVGSAVTSYARAFTITAAQANYHGVNNRGFIYADTDSIHCDLEPDELVGIPVDKVKFCHWKLETSWDKAIFVRQKTYIEHVTHENLEPIAEPYYNIKCAGMSKQSKEIFTKSLEAGRPLTEKDFTKEEYNEMPIDVRQFFLSPHKLSDFKVGFSVPGKLMPKQIRGGTLLVNTTFKLRG
jgi:hypothetical protein